MKKSRPTPYLRVMAEIKHGGKREGSGRKPTDNPKEAVTIYVPKKSIYPFGNKEKLRLAIEDFILSKQPDVQIKNLNEPTEQIKAFEQPKSNYQINTAPASVSPIMSKRHAYEAEIKATATKEALEKVMKQVNSDILSWKDKEYLKQIAQQHFTQNFYAD